jgi:hypothetical protein
LDSQLGSTEQSFLDNTDPLAEWHRATLSMVDVALQIVQAFPDAPGVQLRLCEGLELILAAVQERVGILTHALEKRNALVSRVDALADLLSCLESGRPIDQKPFREIAEAIVGEAHQTTPLRFHYPFDIQVPQAHGQHSGALEPDSPETHWVARFVACHGIIVAHVTARVTQPSKEWRIRSVEAVLAALVHDVGMLRVPAAIVAQKEPLSVDQKRLVEDHCRLGAEIVARMPACPSWLAEAANGHHERLDGTGYPSGLKETAIAPLTRLLSVCDVYGAMCAPRPYRITRDTRTALTDTLLLAEQGALDRDHAERLLHLSFYPIGSVVELADGAIGEVVAGPNRQLDLNSPARPVVAILTGPNGQSLPRPVYLDLSRWEGHSIVRCLTPSERRRLLGKHHPELV